MERVPELNIYFTEHHPELNREIAKLAGEQGSARIDRWMDEYAALYPTGLNPTGTPLFYATHGAVQTGRIEFDYWWLR